MEGKIALSELSYRAFPCLSPELSLYDLSAVSLAWGAAFPFSIGGIFMYGVFHTSD
jgi:hypothetical protein